MNKKIKKLSLNAETLRSLDDRGLEQAAGAATAFNCATNGTNRCTDCTRACTICIE
jgi:ribosomal protein L28